MTFFMIRHGLEALQQLRQAAVLGQAPGTEPGDAQGEWMFDVWINLIQPKEINSSLNQIQSKSNLI